MDAKTAGTVAGVLGPLLTLAILLMICRIPLSWYPNLNVKKLPWSIAVAPTEPLLGPTRRAIPPVGGVDVAPVSRFLLYVGVLRPAGGRGGVRDLQLARIGCIGAMQDPTLEAGTSKGFSQLQDTAEQPSWCQLVCPEMESLEGHGWSADRLGGAADVCERDPPGAARNPQPAAAESGAVMPFDSASEPRGALMSGATWCLERETGCVSHS